MTKGIIEAIHRARAQLERLETRLLNAEDERDSRIRTEHERFQLRTESLRRQIVKASERMRVLTGTA